MSRASSCRRRSSPCPPSCCRCRIGHPPRRWCRSRTPTTPRCSGRCAMPICGWRRSHGGWRRRTRRSVPTGRRRRASSFMRSINMIRACASSCHDLRFRRAGRGRGGGAGSAAAKAGVQANDTIAAVDGKPFVVNPAGASQANTATRDADQRQIAAEPADRPLRLTLLRHGQRREVTGRGTARLPVALRDADGPGPDRLGGRRHRPDRFALL